MASDNLLPCPFCGREPELDWVPSQPDGDPVPVVECSAANRYICPMVGVHVDPIAWNTRSPTGLTEKVATLERQLAERTSERDKAAHVRWQIGNVLANIHAGATMTNEAWFDLLFSLHCQLPDKSSTDEMLDAARRKRIVGDK